MRLRLCAVCFDVSRFVLCLGARCLVERPWEASSTSQPSVARQIRIFWSPVTPVQTVLSPVRTSRIT